MIEWLAGLSGKRRRDARIRPRPGANRRRCFPAGRTSMRAIRPESGSADARRSTLSPRASTTAPNLHGPDAREQPFGILPERGVRWYSARHCQHTLMSTSPPEVEPIIASWVSLSGSLGGPGHGQALELDHDAEPQEIGLAQIPRACRHYRRDGAGSQKMGSGPFDQVCLDISSLRNSAHSATSARSGFAADQEIGQRPSCRLHTKCVPVTLMLTSSA